MSRPKNTEAWLLKEVTKALALIEHTPREQPQSKTANPQYAAGLYDMASWIQEILTKERDWQELRAFLGPAANALPEHGYELVVNQSRDT